MLCHTNFQKAKGLCAETFANTFLPALTRLINLMATPREGEGGDAIPAIEMELCTGA